MKQKLTLLAAVALVALPAAFAAPRTPRQLREAQVSDPFRLTPKARALGQEWQGLSLPRHSTLKSVVSATDTQLPASENVAYLDMPDGTTWFVTCDYDKTVVFENEYTTEYDYTGIKATIFNDKYEPVGYIESPIEKPGGMERCTNVQFGACASKKFFNVNDAYEVMVMVNFKPEGAYGAIPYTYVFSLKGADTPADRIGTFDGYYTQAVNNASDSFSEDFFMTFLAGEQYIDADPSAGTTDQMIWTFDVYSKASWSSPAAVKIGSFPVDMLYASGDGDNETLPVLINSHGRTVYVTQSQYEKTFFENPSDPTNQNVTEDNSYIIKLFKKDDSDSELQEAGTTVIECEAPEPGYYMRSYSVGGFSGGNDISFDFDDDNPSFIVSVVNTDIHENTLANFDVISSADGAKLKTFGLGNAGFLRLSDAKGFGTQYCFLMPTGSGDMDFEYQMYDYPSMQKACSVPVVLTYEGLDMALSLSLDRVAEEGACKYAFALSRGLTDDTDNTCHPVAWFDADGQLECVDMLNAGRKVNLIKPYINANGLGRWLFNTDDSREYLMFVQRRESDSSSAARTELMVVNDKGETQMQYAFSNQHSQISATLVNIDTNPAIWLAFYSYADKKLHSEFISLPLNKFEGTGTVADPYLLRTRGDLEQIKFNLNKHYRLANDIDYAGDAFEPVGGLFTGSIDGGGHMIRNFTLTGAPMFSMVGSLGSTQKSFIKDLTLRGVRASGAEALLAGRTSSASIENVRIVDAVAEGSGLYDFGMLVNNAATGTQITACAVRGDITLPETMDVGGIVSTLGNDSKIKASSFAGTIVGKQGVGGIAAVNWASSSITDCHVTATFEAGCTIGGVVAYSQRGEVKRCLVEGSITATEPTTEWSEYEDRQVPMTNVGGIAGVLDVAPVEYDQNGNPIEPDPNLPPVISDCVVALDEISIPADPALKASAHRIVGRTCLNDGPKALDQYYDETIGDWVTIWGDAPEVEEKLADNYAVSDLAVIDPEVADDAASTEGKSIAFDELDRDFFEARGFVFMGYDADEPWLMGAAALPVLWFEPAVGQFMEFVPGEVSAKVDEPAVVALRLEDVDFESLTISSSDETKCMANPVEVADNGDIMVEIRCSAVGDYTVTATNGNVSAVLLVKATSGIDGVQAAGGMSYDGMTVTADGCDITLWSMAGTAVATGKGAVDVTTLAGGVYVAVATTADGRRMTLKINVR